MTERAHLILCDPGSPSGLAATGANVGRAGNGERPALQPGGHGGDPGGHGGDPGGHGGDPGGHGGDAGRSAGKTNVSGNVSRIGAAPIGLERVTRTAGPSRVASGGGTARVDRAVVVNRASGVNRAGVHPAASGEVAA
ncbi:hypothetical protein GCM10022255_019620 [Dactylosporangium darangshiense]|uniref:PE-PGRS family protein n=1 Tax=Dactylosporangium darangshiense TaxID=579108 RepID=A0ABP8D3S1_9ACTN